MSSRAEQLAELEQLCTAIGERIAGACDHFAGLVGGKIGFALLLFEFGPGDDEWSTYMSNAQRGDMVKALRECADNIEAGLTADTGTGGRLPS